MDQPFYWTFLAGVVLVGATARLRNGGPLARGRAAPLSRVELVAGAASLVALVLHCTVMFFAPWTDAVPGLEPLGDAVRALGPVSQWTYWVPAAVLVLTVRRMWWPAPALLAVTLAGVGITMFWPYPLSTHLGWLAAALVSWVVIAASLVDPPRRQAPAHAG